MVDRPKLSDPQVRAKLAQLKKIGLYNGNLRRKQPTRYGKSILNKYMDVLEGKAHVVTVKTRREASTFRETQRVTRKKVVVRASGAAETARYAPKQKEITVTRRNAQGETYTRRVIKKSIRSKDQLPKLKKNEAYAVPFNRWGETSYMTFTNENELWNLITEYEPKYKGITRHIEIWSFKGARRDEYEDEDI